MWVIALIVIAAVVIWIVARKNPDFKEKVGVAVAAVVGAVVAFWEQLSGMWQ